MTLFIQGTSPARTDTHEICQETRQEADYSGTKKDHDNVSLA